MSTENSGKPLEQHKSSVTEDTEDDDLINDDDLLDDEDLKKPDVSSLRVCSTTKKRKACANCTCGLSEEIEKEEIQKIRENSQNAKSSCGSCHLGDAFRCASCPYNGLPAFKPGQQVILDNQADLQDL